MFSVFSVQRKSLPDEKSTNESPQNETEISIDTNHIHNHDRDQYPKQTTDENKKVLCFKTFKFYRLPYSFIDMIGIHNHDLKEE